MNRANFLKTITAPAEPASTNLLEPHSQPLTIQQVLHLLKRATFATDWKTAQSLVGKTATEIVDLLISNAEKNPLPSVPSWIDDQIESPWKKPAAEVQKFSDIAYKKVYDENSELKRMWMKTMSEDLLSIREKMTLFWHGHFTTKFAIDAIHMAQMMYRQIDLFRKNSVGNFAKLAKEITLDNSMLLYLNGDGSTKKSPNENYSRELLELYTVGIGHYTEKDVQEGARVLTGWRCNIFKEDFRDEDYYKPYFNPSEHDTGSKTYLGETITTKENTRDWVRTNEVHGLIDVILKRKSAETAMFMCEKLYKYFVYSNPSAVNQTIVKDMAKTFIESNFEVKPVLKQLLTSKFFFDKSIIGSQIKTPSESIVGLTKHFDVKGDWKEWVMVTMGQELLNPPNVAGWPGYRKWVDTRTFPFAVQQMGYFMWNQKDEDVVNWVKQYNNYSDPLLLVEQILIQFFAKPATKTQIEKYTGKLLGGAPYYEWETMLKSPATAGNKIKYLFQEIIKNPNFHLS